MNTTDPTVVWTVIAATAPITGGVFLLLKTVIDAATGPRITAPAVPRTPAPALPTVADYRPHAQPAAPDETAPLTTVHVGRHRKGTHRCI